MFFRVFSSRSADIGFQKASLKYCLFQNVSVTNSGVQAWIQIQIEYIFIPFSFASFAATSGFTHTFAAQSVTSIIIFSLFSSLVLCSRVSMADNSQSHIAVPLRPG